MDEVVDVDSLIDGLIDREGGFVDHPADKGGPTCFGITQAVARAHGYAGPMRRQLYTLLSVQCRVSNSDKEQDREHHRPHLS
jgi:glycosyl hydrolase family 108